MENASKALIMAASVLIAIIIIGALVLMYNQISNYSSGDVQNTREQQVIAFNNEYEKFNSNNVNGTDMLTLMNKIIDYNRRKSDATDLQYQEMEIVIDLTGNLSDLKWENSRGNLLVKETQYTKDNISQITNDAEELERKFGKDIINELVSNVSLIDSDGREPGTYAQVRTYENQRELLEPLEYILLPAYRNKYANWEELLKSTEFKNDIYSYYEYVQFKRANFECTGTEYNNETGRIVKMNFKFQGRGA